METTYKNRALFKDSCKQCTRPIYPSETIITVYRRNSDKKSITVLEAYKTHATLVTPESYCASCKK
jgi:hypothetical protein